MIMSKIWDGQKNHLRDPDLDLDADDEDDRSSSPEMEPRSPELLVAGEEEGRRGAGRPELVAAPASSAAGSGGGRQPEVGRLAVAGTRGRRGAWRRAVARRPAHREAAVRMSEERGGAGRRRSGSGALLGPGRAAAGATKWASPAGQVAGRE